MSKHAVRGWMNSLFSRRGRTGRRYEPARVRLALERFEDRLVPSSTILLNQVDPITQAPVVPDWTAVGPAAQNNGGTINHATVSGRISGVAVDPTNPSRIFVTAASGGIWRSLDGGAHWTPLTDHLPATTPTTPVTSPVTTIADSQRTLNMGAIAIAPSNPNVIYAAEGEGDQGTTGFGVLVSTDGGNTWTLTGTNVFAGISAHSIVVDTIDPNIAFVANEGFNGGIYRTTDGGNTWVNITSSSPVFGGNSVFTDVDIAPRTSAAQPITLYSALGAQSGDPHNGIYRSTDALSAAPSWNELIGGSALVPGAGPGNIQMALAPSLPSTIYASIGDRQNPLTGDEVLLGVYKSTDGGSNWQRLGTPPNYVPNYLGTQAGYDNVVVVSPTNPNEVILAGDGTGPQQSQGAVLLTTNGGSTFTDITTATGTSPHTDDHAGAFDSTGQFHMGTDGGLFRYTFGTQPKWLSENGTNTSNPTATALNTIQFYSVAIHPTDANFALGGSQDNGTARFADNVGWTQTDGGDGEKVLYDYDNPLHALHVIPLNSGSAATYIEITDDGGLTWRPYSGTIQNLVPAATVSPSTLIIDPSRSQRYFMGTDQISISEDGGDHWGQTYQFAAGATQMVPSDPSSGQMPPDPITALAVGRSEAAGQLPMLLAAHSGGAIYQLFLPPPPNPAPAQTDWINIAASMPVPFGVFFASKIIVDPQNSENAYIIGSDLNGTFHVFRTQDLNAVLDVGTLPHWTDITGSLPSFFFAGTMALDTRNFSDPFDDVLYVGGNAGQIYELADPAGSAFNWTRVGNSYNSTTGKGMPDVDISDLELNTTTGILAAGTFGRGMWEIQVRGLIRGEVFTDTNGNGTLDAGETGQAGVVVRLVNADNGVEIANTTTDANGFYTFRSLTNSQLTATNYEVVEIAPTGQVQTTPLLTFNNLNEGSTFDVSDPNLDKGKVVIGNFTPGTISGTKFDDRNDNGVKDSGEPGVANFTIYIDSNNNGVLDPSEISATTAANGSFSFTNLGPAVINGQPNPVTFNGTYLIREVQQVGWTQTTAALPPISLTSGQSVTGQLIGNMRTASIAGTKFVDTNGDGVREPGEPGLGGITIQATGPGGTRTVTTAADGTYSILSLAPGTYTVTEVVPTGWTQTTAAPAPVTLGLATHALDVDFGNFQNVTISGTKFNDLNGNGTFDNGEPGLAGFVIQLINPATGTVVATSTTTAAGAFSFPNVGPLPGGAAYNIKEVQQTGWVETTPVTVPLTPSSGTNVGTIKVGNFKTYSIAGKAYVDLNGNSVFDGADHGALGFVVQLKDGSGNVVATATSAANGTYSLAGVGPGNFTLVEAPRTGFKVTQGFAGYAIAGVSGSDLTGKDFGNQNKSITVASLDAGGPPTVIIRDTQTEQVIRTIDAYGTFMGGVRVATGLFNGSQAPVDIVTAPGPGGGPDIRVFDSSSGALVREFYAYDPRFTGGVYVAVGDVNGDGTPDIITGADAGGGPHVREFDGRTGAVIREFFAYDAGFHGGVRVAAADVDGDGFADVITGAGPGGGPHVKVFSGKTNQTIRSFFAYAANMSAGVFVAGGDVNGDGFADIITGPGVGGGPHLRVFDGATDGSLLGETYAFPPTSLSGGQLHNTAVWTSGLRVAVTDYNLDGLADIIVGEGTGQSPRIRIFDGATLADILPASQEAVYDPGFLGGIFVAGN